MAVPIPPTPRTIGPYTIVAYLGGGGMAEVFLAVKRDVDGMFQRHVAIKRILPQHVGDEQFRSQFAEEVRLVGRLRHPHIVAALDSGKDGGLYYLVLEWIDGTDLAQVLEWCERSKQAVPLPVVLHIAYGVASALSYIHAPPFQVIHRDLSPHNVLLGTCGEVKLSDFGISRFAGREYRTRTNLLKGKIAYMSPEQLQPLGSEPEEIDSRSDLFSLGTVLYELVTGANPFTSAKGFLAQAQAVLLGNEALGYEKGLRHAPVELARLIRHLHARAPERRPASTEQVVRALRSLQRIGGDAALEQLVRAWKARAPGAEDQSDPHGKSAPRRPTPAPTESLSRARRPPSPPRFSAQPTLELTEHAVACDAAAGEPALCVADASFASTGFTSAFSPIAAAPNRAAAPQSSDSTHALGAASAPGRARGRVKRIAALLSVAIAGSGGALLAFGRDDDEGRARGATRAGAPSTYDGGASSSTTRMPAPIPTPVAPPPRESAEASTPTATTPEAGPSVRVPDVAPHAPERSSGELERASSARRNADGHATSQVRVVVRPWGRVWIDGRLVGQAPVEVSGLSPGDHRIEAGYDRPVQSHVVELRAGKATFAYDLE